MNEITKIHLGRQAFTIAVDAHKALQEYLRAIKRHMGDSDEAVEEVELRMAELLAERGIHDNKVVLLKDVEYLKSQLGEPGDFGYGEDEIGGTEATAPKRLFRDTEHGMIAGVAAGLAAYFGVKPAVFRVIFVVGLLTVFGGLFNVSLVGGFGVMTLLYVILWIIIPEAKTSSERLQMQGRQVTVDALKDVVERADVKGAASRAQRLVSVIVGGALRVIATIIGYGLVLAGIVALMALTTFGVYWMLNHDLVPAHVFPVGAGEVALICLAFVVVAIAASFLLIAGLAVIRRRWPLSGWVLGALVAVSLASAAVAGALIVDAAPKIQERYEAAKHSYVRTVPEFNTVRVLGNMWVNVHYEQSSTYSVVGSYWGDAKFSSLATNVNDGALTIDARPLAQSLRCRKLCLLQSSLAEIVVRAPDLQNITVERGAPMTVPKFHNQSISVRTVDTSVAFTDIVADTVRAKLGKDGVWALTATGDYVDPNFAQRVSFYGQSADISGRNIELEFEGVCGVTAEPTTGPSIVIGRFENLTINGEKIGSPADLRAAYDKPGNSAAKCLHMPSDLIDNL